jgi:hypothetical protein
VQCDRFIVAVFFSILAAVVLLGRPFLGTSMGSATTTASATAQPSASDVEYVSLTDLLLVRGDLRRIQSNDLATDSWRLYGGITFRSREAEARRKADARLLQPSSFTLQPLYW